MKDWGMLWVDYQMIGVVDTVVGYYIVAVVAVVAAVAAVVAEVNNLNQMYMSQKNLCSHLILVGLVVDLLKDAVVEMGVVGIVVVVVRFDIF